MIQMLEDKQVQLQQLTVRLWPTMEWSQGLFILQRGVLVFMTMSFNLPLSTPTTITSHTQLHQSMSVSKLKCWFQERTIQRVNYGRDSANSTNSFSSSASSNRSVPDWEQSKCEWCLTMFGSCNYSFISFIVKQHCNQDAFSLFH